MAGKSEGTRLRRRKFSEALAAAAVPLSNEPIDVAVIGAGVFGAWSAYMLRSAGLSVTLLDAYGPANSRASSGGESRIIRAGYGSDEIYSRWAYESLPNWKELARTSNQPLFHRTGVLWLARPDDPRAVRSRETLTKLKIPLEPLTEAELARRYPQIRPAPGMIGVLEPESGALMARRAVQVLVEQAIRKGCEYVKEPVAPPEGKGKLDAVRTAGGRRVAAGTFVFACGPWLPKVFPELLGKRIFPTRQQVLFFGTPYGDNRFVPPRLPVWIDFSVDEGAYGFPDLENRGFKLAFDRHGPPFDPDTGMRLVNGEAVNEARRYLGERFPALRDAPVVESRVCQYENTSNGDFLIDRHPEFENVWLVGGGSGHGYKHGPALGRYVADRVRGLGQAEPRFSLASKGETQHRSVY